MSLSLYMVAGEFRQALAVLEEGDFDEQAVRDTLDGLIGTVEVKASNVAAYILNIEAEAEAIAQAEERLKTRRKALEKRAAWLRDYVKGAMEACGITEITAQDKTFRVRVRLNPESVVLDGSLPDLPPEFIREKIIREPDKVAIMAALKAGREVPGARLERKTRLEIK